MKEVEFVKKYGLKIGIVIVVILILVIGAWYGIKEYRLSYEVPEVKQVNYYVVEEEGKIVKRKDIDMKPMDEEEAVLQIELLNHDFFVFKNIDEDCVSVLYKRKDGSYGIINVK